MVIKKIAVLFSGSGSNLESILQKIHNQNFSTCKIEVACLISNNEGAYGIKRAEKYGLQTVVVNHLDYPNRDSFDRKLVQIIKKKDIDLVVLAGFMRVLTKVFTNKVNAINLHPSLLPLFKGASAIEDSYNSDMKVGGISIHYVSEELDGGKIIAQECFKKNDMTKEEFKAKIHSLEHELLPKIVIELLDG